MKLNLSSKSNKRSRKNVLIPIFLITLSIGGILIFLNYTVVEQLITGSSEISDLLISRNQGATHEQQVEINSSPEELNLESEWLDKIPAALEETEWLVVVDRSEQREYVFQNRKFIKSYVVSTGSKDRYDYDATLPIGTWKISEKIPYSLGEIYGPRLMYIEWWNGSEFEKTLKALHGTNEPENLGNPTSLGCVYHANDDIIELFDMLPEGSLVLTIE